MLIFRWHFFFMYLAFQWLKALILSCLKENSLAEKKNLGNGRYIFYFFFITGVISVLLLVSNDVDVLKIPPPAPPFNLYFPWFRRFSNFPVTKYFFPSSENYFPVACFIIFLIWHNTLLLLICSFENFVHLPVENHLYFPQWSSAVNVSRLHKGTCSIYWAPLYFSKLKRWCSIF